MALTPSETSRSTLRVCSCETEIESSVIGCVACIFLTRFASAGFNAIVGNQLVMGPLEYTQENALIPGFVAVFVGFFGNIAAAWVIPRVGVWKAFFVGSGVQWLGLVAFGWWPIFFMNRYDCFSEAGCPKEMWIPQLGPVICGSIVSTLAGCFAGPASFIILSKEVRQDEQASVQAAFALLGSVSGMFGNPVFTKYFFNTNAKGWAIVNFVWASCAINAVAFCIIIATFFLNQDRIRYHDDMRNQGIAKRKAAEAASEAEVAPLLSAEQQDRPQLVPFSAPIGAVICDMLLFGSLRARLSKDPASTGSVQT